MNYPQNTQESFFFHREEALFRCGVNSKTGNAFVTESLPEYTIFCFFAACSEVQDSEVITNESESCCVLSVLAF